ncbi:hypothetical protein ACEPAG_2147 [Sanghuangporus baumii]
MASMASLQLPQARPRPLSAYSLDSVTSGPYLSAYPSTSVASVRRRTSSSQTFRPSPLAGPVLSYAGLSELDTSTSTSSHSHESSLSGPSAEGSTEGLLKSPQRCKSMGTLATLDEDRLQPPMPAWTRSSRRSVVSVHSSRSLSRTTSMSSTSSIPTISSLISVSVSEEPEPHGTYSGESHRLHVHKPPALCISEADIPDLYAGYRTTPTSSLSLPTRRHSRLSFSPSLLLSPALSERTSPTSSLRSATSASSTSAYIAGGTDERSDCRRVRIQEHETTREESVSSRTEKQRRRSSLPASALAPVDKHDWLTATPTPIFSRSALRTQGVVMPVSARDHQRVRERSRTSSISSQDVRDGNGGKRDGDKAKVEERVVKSGKPKICADRGDDHKPRRGGGGANSADGSEAKVKSSKSLGLAVNLNLPRRRRSILIRVPSFASFLSSSKDVKDPDVDGIVNEAKEDEFGKLNARYSDSESSSATSTGDSPPPSSSSVSSSSSISDPSTDFPSSSSSSSSSSSASLPTPTSNPSLPSPSSSTPSSAGPTPEPSHPRLPKPPIYKIKPDPKQSKRSEPHSTIRTHSKNVVSEKEKFGLGLSFTHHSSLREIWRKLSVRTRTRK